MFSSRWTDERPPSLSSSPDQHPSSDRILPSPLSTMHSFPRIQSSPSSPSFPQEDYHLSWDPPIDPKVSYPLPSFRSLFPSDDEHPLTSEYDASEYSEPEAAQDDSFLTESEDEEQDPFFSDSRVTFTVSAERGRWKSDPLPRHAFLRISARTTSPAPSPVPSIAQRNISEPAPSTTKSPILNDSVPEQQISPPVSSSPPPLPEHTSPVLSPISLSVSPMVGSVSPLSVLEPLSPLSLPPSSLAGDHDMDMDLESFPENDEVPTPMESETGLGLFDAPPVMPQPASCPSPRVAIVQPSASIIESIEVVPTTSSAKTEEDHVVRDSTMDVDSSAPKQKDAGSKQHDEPIPSASNDVKTVAPTETASRPKKVTKTEEKKKQDAPQQVDKGKKRASRPPPRDEVPKSKKARIAQPPPEASTSRPTTQTRSKRVEGRKRSALMDENRLLPHRKTQQRKARPRSPSLSESSSRSSSVSPEEPSPKPTPELDPELCGMLIECMATSRASSLPMSTLYKNVMQSYPSLKSRGSDDECLELMERVLEGGTVAGGGSGVFGKVLRNGKDELDPPLESQWFYVSERDPDKERAQLISSMMPRPAKRTETKKYKQYYYRPLEKISRWDPEDEL
ncbi:hypothetical protein MSAN_02158600 [Mycena sanguinolenta]|uniref:Uncharacterized protein n=1 Tax=Mycena sanguinolenta TaxID=230812 RepID=A0A8H7CIZ9_9AGAR|nr:hypothetical protein MSAN_02158600 [Mycena sanguinolenta]